MSSKVIPKKTRPWTITEVISSEHGGDVVAAEKMKIQRGNIVVTDPCYNYDVWCRMNDVSLVPDDYICVARFSDEGEWGIRVAKIGLYRSDAVREEMEKNIHTFVIGSIGVDAGLAGIFEKKVNFTDEQWHDFCNDIRIGDAWMIDGELVKGFFSSSGYGDGGYDVVVHKDPCVNPFDGIEIIFIDNEEEDE